MVCNYSGIYLSIILRLTCARQQSAAAGKLYMSASDSIYTARTGQQLTFPYARISWLRVQLKKKKSTILPMAASWHKYTVPLSTCR